MRWVGLLAVTLLGGSSTVAARPPARPNVVFILADDLGWGDLGCYNRASKIPTPRLDRLASEGLRFTDAHSPSAVCTPTHYGLMGGPEILDNQIEFIRMLRAEVKKLADAGKTPAEAKAAVDAVKSVIQQNERIANYGGGMFASQVKKVFVEFGGKPFESALHLTWGTKAALQARAGAQPDRFADFSTKRR
jgi:hypothetical protein